MAATSVWIAAYGGPYPGATPMYRSSDPAATPIQIVGYGVPPSGGVPSGVTPIWISTPAASGAVAASVVAVGGGSGAGTVIGSTWSAADASANGMTLSNGGMNVTGSGGGWQSIRTSGGKISGKLYIEFYDVTGADNIMFGLASSGFVATNYLGTSNYSVGIWPTNPPFCSSGFSANYSASSLTGTVSGDVYALAVDFAAGNVWIAHNNVWINSSNPATGSLPIISFVPATVGALFAGISLQGGPDTWTLQSAPASQKYLPPPGFQAWDGGPVTPVTSTWSAADASANSMTLSNGNMTVTPPSGGTTTKSIRGTVGKTSGKYYVEFLAVSRPGGTTFDANGWGLADAGFDATSYLGNSNYSGGSLDEGYGNYASAGFSYNYAIPNIRPGATDVWAIAADFTAGQFWIAQNNVWFGSGNPGSGSNPMGVITSPALGLVLFPAIMMQGLNSGVWTLQSTAASQKYAPPSGFTAWG